MPPIRFGSKGNLSRTKKEKVMNLANPPVIFDGSPKTCSKCNVSKPLLSFGKHPGSNGKWYRANHCKSCSLAAIEKWKEKNPHRVRKAQRKCHIQKEYGITADQYDEMLSCQKFTCAICKQKETRITKSTGEPQPLSVDHDHASGDVRGLLCGDCNRMIGLGKNSPSILRAAAEYLEMSK